MECKVTARKSHYPKDVPFELPEGWVWTEISEIASTINYGVSESAKAIGKYRLLRITDIQDGKVSWESVPFTDYPEDKAKAFELSDGDILFARTGATVGKSYLVMSAPNNAIFASYLIRVQYSHSVIPQYIKFFFESGYYWGQISSSSVGVGQPNVNGTSLGKLRIPLPPAAEQKRISEEAHRWMDVIDSLESEAQHLNEDIGSAKSKILDLAIHGKLVPQDPTDEPAIELLKRINPGFHPSHNLHYDVVPMGWEECRIGDVVEILNGYSFKSNEYSLTGIRVIRITNVQGGYMYDDEPKFFPEQRKSEVTQYLLLAGDLLMSLTGNVGRVAFIEEDFLPAVLNQRVACLRSRSNRVILEYLFYLLQTKQFTRDCVASGKGVAQLNISTEWLKKYPILLPPLDEQQRIVANIRRLFGILEDVINSI